MSFLTADDVYLVAAYNGCEALIVSVEPGHVVVRLMTTTLEPADEVHRRHVEALLKRRTHAACEITVIV